MMDLNLIGMILNLVGSVLIAIFGLPPLDVTRQGEKQTMFVEHPTKANIARYWRHWILGRVGVVLMALGFALQLYAYKA